MTAPRVEHGEYQFALGHGEVRTLWYADGTIRAEHPCMLVPDGNGADVHLITAPALDGQHIVAAESWGPEARRLIASGYRSDGMTVRPGIRCGHCGLTGWVWQGRWVTDPPLAADPIEVLDDGLPLGLIG